MIIIPKDVLFILKKLHTAGYEGYIVGGAVRDVVLNQTPHDWDITTNATPEQTKELFDKTIDTGLKHGTVTIVLNDENYEVTTYRIDGEYSDGRHPDSVQFTSKLQDDLARRDFTINALAMNKDGFIIDYFGGINDIHNKIIRTVGSPDKRFEEDALRMMRAIRFAAKLGFAIEKNTYQSIQKNAYRLENVSQERITSEFTKTLESQNPEKIVDMVKTGLTKLFFSELDNIPLDHLTNLLEISKQTNNVLLRYALLLETANSPDNIMRRFKFSNNHRTFILNILVYSQMTFKSLADIRYYVAERGLPFAENVYEYQKLTPKKYADADKLINQMREVTKDGTAITLRQLAVNGNDLLKLGYRGQHLRYVLNTLYHTVLADPTKNDKNTLLKLVPVIE